MIRYFIAIFIPMMLLWTKALYDVKRANNGYWINHTAEWLLLFGLTINVIFFVTGYPNLFPFTWYDFRRDLEVLLIFSAIGWFYFDFAHNSFAGQKLDYVSPPSVHQSLSDRFLTWVGVKYQYFVKGFYLLLTIGIVYFILK